MEEFIIHFLENLNGKTVLWIPRRRWDDNINMYLREAVTVGPVAGF
jgi:hypothetical protein